MNHNVVGLGKHNHLLRLWSFSLRLLGSVMFGATFNLVTRVGLGLP